MQVGPYTLRPQQVDAYQRLQKSVARLMSRGIPPRVILQAVPGWGKGLPPTAKVLTPSGWVEIGSLSKGDLVIGKDGKPTVVSGVFHRGIQPLFRIRFSDGAETICDKDHLWTVQSCRTKKWETIETSVLAKRRIKYENKRAWKIPTVDPVHFDKQELEIHPYVMGVLLGDGAIKYGVEFHCPEREIADRVGKFLPDGVVVTKRKSENRCQCWGIKPVGVKSNPIKDSLKKYGLLGTGSHEKFIPPQYLLGSPEDRLLLLAGLLDTDAEAGTTVEISTSSERLAGDIKELVQGLGGRFHVSDSIPEYIHLGNKKTGKRSYRINLRMPNGVNPFLLKRKRDGFAPRKNGFGRWIDSVEEFGSGDSVCIKVENEDGLFVTENYVVTHNTVFSAALIQNAVAKGKKCLFLAHGRQLIFQKSNVLSECKMRHAVLMSSCKGHIDPVYAHEHKGTSLNYDVLVASKDTLQSRSKSGFMDKTDFDLVISDEVHLNTSSAWLRIYNQNRNAVVVGLSATPALGDGKPLPYFKEIIVAQTYKELLDSEILVPCRVFAPYVVDSRAKLQSNGEYSSLELSKDFNEDKLTGDIVENWFRFGENRPTFIYGTTVEHAIALKHQFRRRGVSCECVEANTPQNERAKMYRDFLDGKIKVISNWGILRTGVNLPKVSCIQLATKMGSLNSFLQTVGRGFRTHEESGKVDCIAEGQEVLTNRGLVPIEKVCKNDLLWDGLEWVSHQGAVCKGEQDVIEYAGLTATEGHKVWTEKGWQTIRVCAMEQIRIACTGSGWDEIKLSCNHFRGRLSKRQEQRALLYDKVRYLRKGGAKVLPQHDSWSIWLQEMWCQSPQEKTSTTMAYPEVFWGQAEVRKRKTLGIQGLRRPWYKVLFSFPKGHGNLDSGKSWPEGRRIRNRQNRQRQELRSRESQMVYTEAECMQHTGEQGCCGYAQVEDSLSRSKVFGFHNNEIDISGIYPGANSRQVPQQEIIKTKRRVWDILNSGPRNRFTVSGLLVSNCTIIDHGANVHVHSWPQIDREWSLDPKEPGVSTPKPKEDKPDDKIEKTICCPKCCAMRPASAGGVCLNCGHRHQRTGLKVRTADGRLREITESEARKSAEKSDEQKLWLQKLAIAANAKRGSLPYSAAAKMFHNDTGKWPEESKVGPVVDGYKRDQLVATLWPNFVRRRR